MPGFASNTSVEMRCFRVWRRATLHMIRSHFLSFRISALTAQHSEPFTVNRSERASESGAISERLQRQTPRPELEHGLLELGDGYSSWKRCTASGSSARTSVTQITSTTSRQPYAGAGGLAASVLNSIRSLSRQVAVALRRFLDRFRSAAFEYVSSWHARVRPHPFRGRRFFSPFVFFFRAASRPAWSPCPCELSPSRCRGA